MAIEIKFYKRPLTRLSIAGSRVRVTPGVLAKFSSALFEKGINIECVSSGEYSVSFYVDQKDGEKAARALRRILVKKSAFEALVRKDNIAMMSVSGKEFMETPGMLLRLIQPLGEKRINIAGVSSSYESLMLFFEWKDGRKAFKLMEKSFKDEVYYYLRAK